MTEPLITSHVYWPKPPPALKGVPEDGCAYAGCGQPPDAHQRRVSGRHRPDSGPGRVAPAGGRGAGERDPGRETGSGL